MLSCGKERAAVNRGGCVKKRSGRRLLREHIRRFWDVLHRSFCPCTGVLLHGAAAPRALVELAGAAPAAEGRAFAGPSEPRKRKAADVRACLRRVSFDRFLQDPVAAHNVLQKVLGLKGGLPKASREQAPTGGSM